MGDGQRERCLVNGREVEREEELKSQEVSIRVSRLAEEPGEFWSSAAASLKPSVRVTISVGGLGQAQNDAGGGTTGDGAGGGGDSGSSSSGGGVVVAAGETRGYDTARSERVVGRRMVVGTGSLSGSSGDSSNWQMQAQQALSRRSGLCGALRAIVPPCVSSLGLGSDGCWSWFTRLGGGGTARRGTGGQSAGDRVGSSVW